MWILSIIVPDAGFLFSISYKSMIFSLYYITNKPVSTPGFVVKRIIFILVRKDRL